MPRQFDKRWLVVCDDEMFSCSTRREARSRAERLNGHPANADIRNHGPYKNVTGTARIIELPWVSDDEIGRAGHYEYDAAEDAK